MNAQQLQESADSFKILLARVSVAIVCCLTLASVTLAQDGLAGRWIGKFEINGESIPIRTSFDNEGSELKGTVDLPIEQLKTSLTAVNLSGSKLSFKAVIKSTELSFTGETGRGFIKGEVASDAHRGTFELRRLFPARPQLYDKLAGNYQFGGARFVSIGPVQRFEDGLQFIDFGTLRTGSLQPVSETEFIAGPSIGINYPPEINVVFKFDSKGEVEALSWTEGKSRPVIGKRTAPYSREDVTFNNGPVTIAGRLTLPTTDSRHAVIILIPGSGATNREFGPAIYFWIKQGIAVLTYDKRGTGASSGKLESAGIGDLAGDVVAGIDFLKRHPKINARQIGLWGNSNGGWVAPEAAARSKEVAFIILRAASGLPIHQNILYELANDLREKGFTEAEVRRAVSLRSRLSQAVLTGNGWDVVQSEVSRARNEKWFPLARVPARWMTPQDQATVDGVRHVLEFDPGPVWQKVKCPVLAFNGEVDKYVSPDDAVPRLKDLVLVPGIRNRRLIVLPRANHWMFEAESGYSKERPYLKKYVAGFWSVMGSWVKELLPSLR